MDMAAYHASQQRARRTVGSSSLLAAMYSVFLGWNFGRLLDMEVYHALFVYLFAFYL
jgi:hypothetical protein